jgi:hypothetical protein
MAKLTVYLLLLKLLMVSSVMGGVVVHPEAARSHPRNPSPLPPSKDPWYTAPPGFEEAQPGDVLRVRPAPGNLTSVAINSSATYNILYRTTDSQYQPSWAVTTLLIPMESSQHSAQRQQQKKLLSYQMAYDSANVDASPSFELYTDKSIGEIPGALSDISPMLGMGWYVNVPDYEGPRASFLLGVQAGHATIDSIRAVQSLVLPDHGGCILDPGSTRSAMWGYSGGSFATEFAVELQEQYAPGLNLSGVVIGGVPVNATGDLSTVSGAPFAYVIPEGLVGMTSQYPAARAYLVSRLKTTGPYNATTFFSVLNITLLEAIPTFANQDISQYFIGGFQDILAPEILDIINRNGYMGYHGVPRMPVFIYQAIADEVAAIRDTDSLVARFCGVGANILFQRNTVGEHVSEITNGRARALAWLDSVLSGTYAQKYSASGCTVQNVTVGVPLSS